nr:immunoglobulin light chain junction region [Macaca mulatta]MPN96558.1 immunoglobulin light chain junction region [Macaca mulatta]
GMQALQTPFTF